MRPIGCSSPRSPPPTRGLAEQRDRGPHVTCRPGRVLLPHRIRTGSRAVRARLRLDGTTPEREVARGPNGVGHRKHPVPASRADPEHRPAAAMAAHAAHGALAGRSVAPRQLRMRWWRRPCRRTVGPAPPSSARDAGVADGSARSPITMAPSGGDQLLVPRHRGATTAQAPGTAGRNRSRAGAAYCEDRLGWTARPVGITTSSPRHRR